jgi:hypothetical protein
MIEHNENEFAHRLFTREESLQKTTDCVSSSEKSDGSFIISTVEDVNVTLKHENLRALRKIPRVTKVSYDYRVNAQR